MDHGQIHADQIGASEMEINDGISDARTSAGGLESRFLREIFAPIPTIGRYQDAMNLASIA
ncbi:hypothetical protein XH93_10400 [Bradyrhizobium sp. CCBAU 51753]|nr:hypothetical protein XH93_10400 [Bradyrhizobium sp. CCBAU 51753]